MKKDLGQLKHGGINTLDKPLKQINVQLQLSF